jgi:hypothetical protein
VTTDLHVGLSISRIQKRQLQIVTSMCYFPPAGRRPAMTEPASIPPWTFFTNHGHVLLLLAREPDLLLRDVAARVGITERAAQRIVGELEEAAYLTRERDGRRNHYQVHLDRSLRHPVEAPMTVGDLCGLLAKKKRR